jgi:hypothetical protein
MRRLTAGLALCGLLTASGAAAQEPSHPPGHGQAEPPAAAPPAGPDPTRSYPSLHIIGFGDFDFVATDEDRPASNSRFFEGQLVLHLTSELSPRFAFVGEISMTARPEAAVNPAAAGFAIEVERSLVKYTQSDALKLSAGRFHTPISYWNVAYHHGTWLQTTVSRPEMVQFGGQFIPVHFVGVQAEGALPTGSLNLNYGLGVGNGRSTVISRGGDAVDVNNNRALAGTLFVRPDRPSDFQAGGAVYIDKITLPEGSHRETILNAHLAWTRETPEIIAEYAHVRHRDIATGAGSSSWAGYVQAAYRLPLGGAKWKPYARWEQMRVAEGDAVFSGLRDRETFLAGLRFDASDLVALKAEYQGQRSEDDPRINGVFLQAAFSF